MKKKLFIFVVASITIVLVICFLFIRNEEKIHSTKIATFQTPSSTENGVVDVKPHTVNKLSNSRTISLDKKYAALAGGFTGLVYIQSNTGERTQTIPILDPKINYTIETSVYEWSPLSTRFMFRMVFRESISCVGNYCEPPSNLTSLPPDVPYGIYVSDIETGETRWILNDMDQINFSGWLDDDTMLLQKNGAVYEYNFDNFTFATSTRFLDTDNILQTFSYSQFRYFGSINNMPVWVISGTNPGERDAVESSSALYIGEKKRINKIDRGSWGDFNLVYASEKENKIFFCKGPTGGARYVKECRNGYVYDLDTETISEL